MCIIPKPIIHYILYFTSYFGVATLRFKAKQQQRWCVKWHQTTLKPYERTPFLRLVLWICHCYSMSLYIVFLYYDVTFFSNICPHIPVSQFNVSEAVIKHPDPKEVTFALHLLKPCQDFNLMRERKKCFYLQTNSFFGYWWRQQ